jgi:hypothetical protein
LVFFCIWSSALVFILLAGHGGEGEENIEVLVLGAGGRFGSSEASPGSSSVTAFLLSPQTAEGRPLPPHSPMTVSSGRRLMAFNLQATMPPRRPSCNGAVCSRRHVPSGFLPGDVSVGCAVVLQQGGEGAGPDCVSQIFTRVLYVKKLDLIVIFHFLLVLDVKCSPPLFQQSF